MKWTPREYIDLMTFNNPPREMFCELFGLLIGLPEEWKAQGAAESQLSLDAFAFDYIPTHAAGHTGAIDHLPERVIEENEEYVIKTDYLGRTVKMCKTTSTIPLPLDFPVKNMDDWRKVRHMFADAPRRLTQDMIDQAKQKRQEGALIVAGIHGGYDVLRELMGEEVSCLAYYEQPELVEDILGTVSAMNFRVLEELSRQVRIDNLCVHEDLAGKHGPLIGPNIVREFIRPYYRKTWDMLESRGTKLFSQDSDGNMNPVIDSFIEAGVNVFYPCEPAANMDIVELRRKYGKKIAFKGGVDKHVLRRDKAAIRRELEYKMQPEMLGGGTVFALDHRIPNGTPLENYIYYVETARELLGLPPLARTDPAERVWQRMAF
mgnify:CR=1 FL=1